MNEVKHKFELNGEKLFLTMCKTNRRKPWGWCTYSPCAVETPSLHSEAENVLLAETRLARV